MNHVLTLLINSWCDGLATHDTFLRLENKCYSPFASQKTELLSNAVFWNAVFGNAVFGNPPES